MAYNYDSKPPAYSTMMAGPIEYSVYSEDGWTGRKSVSIMHPDKQTEAYFVDFRGSADMVVYRGGRSGQPVGSVAFHTWKSYTELFFTASQQRVEMAKDGMFTKTETLSLPAAPGNPRFWWKTTSTVGSGWLTGNLKLEDANGQVFATFARSAGRHKEGTLCIVVPNLPQDLQDQIVIAFMAIEEKQRRARKRGAAAAAGGAAGGGGGA